MQISKEQPMRPALDDVIDAVNEIDDIEPYITEATNDWLDTHPEATTTVQDDSLTTEKYQDGSVTGAKIATGAVTTEKIANGAVSRDKLAEDAISSNNEPGFTAGSSRAVLGDAETASWMQRTTAADGAALIESVRGNTLVWNQLVVLNNNTHTSNGVTYIFSADGTITVSGTASDDSYASITLSVLANHKYLLRGCPSGGSASTYRGYITGRGFPFVFDVGQGFIASPTDSGNAYVVSNVLSGTTVDGIVFRPQLFDLTAMFGAGNEPSTVAEFEALFPETYYPYDAGSLLPVRIEGVETVAADESWSYQLAILAATYFPDGMRSAGTVRDELRADAAVTRIGERAYQSGDESDSSVVTDGTVTNYALATPTNTTIDPPLPMSYRTGAGGTERVMVASDTQSAPPIFATRYPVNLTDLAESIAPREFTIAMGNHAIGDLIMLGWTLCKATQVIVTGETIEIGTNVTRTSVAAELAALS